MIIPCGWFVFRVWLRHRGKLQIAFALVAITGYCLVLGNYAISSFEHATVHGNRSRPEPNQPVSYVYQRGGYELTPAPPSRATSSSSHAPVVSQLESELSERRRQVMRVCEKYALAHDGTPNAWEFFIDKKHHLVWCNVFKAASSTWMYYFSLLGGYKDQYLRRSNKTPLILARGRFPRPSVEELRAALPTSLSFLVVREPFERLLSAFRNKIENSRNKYYRKLAKEMMVKYRRYPPKAVTTPTFPDFVNYIVGGTKNIRPHYDEHWAPYNDFCTPCHVNFTVVSKLETFERDQEYIIQKAGVGHILVRDLRRHNPKTVVNKANDGKKTESLLEKYFSQLTLEQVTGLYKIYKIDFEMFGYNATKYFHMARKP